ncbi:MAG TPA: hypothetical protein VLB51_11570 [Methylomirabilota bacterium]|nr:hypothetical protein [Methylomirabilota bacterium]
MLQRSSLRVSVVIGILCLVAPTGAWAQENITGSNITAVSPAVVTAGTPATLCFTALFTSPDFEYIDRLDLDLPDGWTVGTVAANSSPLANGCSGALPPVAGTEAGNVVYWQSTGYPPQTGCGAWIGGSAGTSFDFCVDVTSPNCTGAPWDIPWNIVGDSYGGAPHTLAGTFSSVACEGGSGPAITLSKTVGTTPGVCAATNSVTVSTGDDVYYCFVATNTGTVTFEYHDLADDHLGAILDAFPYTLAPGASSPEVIVSDTVTGPVVNTATWTAADAIGGYVIDDTIAVDFEDISGTGTAVTLTDDSTAQFPIGFSFEFYGTAYTDFWVSSNGFLATTGTSNGCCTGQNLPNPSTPNGVIAGWWEDMNPSAGGTHHYQVLGTAPNRRLIFQVTGVPHYGGGNLVTLQYKLFETSNVIEVHYQAAPSDGGTHTAGIENQDGTVAAQYYNGTAALATPLAIRYAPTVPQEASAVATATVNVLDADITVDPTSLLSTQMSNQTATLPLTLGNTGGLDLTWTLEEEPVERNFPPMPVAAGPGDAAVAAERADEQLPAKVPEWFPETVTWFGPDAVLYDNGPVVTHPGGGAGGADASALQTNLAMNTLGAGAQVAAGNRVADDFTITDPAGWDIDTITVFTYQTGSTTTSTINALNVRIWDGPPNAGGTVVWGDTTTNILTGTTWANMYRVTDTTLTTTNRPVMTAVGAVNTVLPAGTYWVDYQIGGTLASGPWVPPVTILGQTTTGNALQYTSTGWAPLTDSGTLTPQGVPFIFEGQPAICGNLADVPWLSASPVAGTIAPAGSQTVNVTFDSTGIALGTYQATLCVFSNDPDEPVVPVPVTMDVVIPVELQSFSIE